MLAQPDARACFAAEIPASIAVEVPDNLVWRAKVLQQDRVRPDLVGSTKSGLPVVKVEAKLVSCPICNIPFFVRSNGYPWPMEGATMGRRAVPLR